MILAAYSFFHATMLWRCPSSLRQHRCSCVHVMQMDFSTSRSLVSWQQLLMEGSMRTTLQQQNLKGNHPHHLCLTPAHDCSSLCSSCGCSGTCDKFFYSACVASSSFSWGKQTNFAVNPKHGFAIVATWSCLHQFPSMKPPLSGRVHSPVSISIISTYRSPALY